MKEVVPIHRAALENLRRGKRRREGSSRPLPAKARPRRPPSPVHLLRDRQRQLEGGAGRRADALGEHLGEPPQPLRQGLVQLRETNAGSGPCRPPGSPRFRSVLPPCAPRYLLVVVVLLQLVLQLLRLARAALGQQLVRRQGRGGGHGQQRRGRSGAARRRKRNRGRSGAGGGAGGGAGTAPPGSAEVAPRPPPAKRRRTVRGLGSRQRLMGKRAEAARGGSGGGSSAVAER